MCFTPQLIHLSTLLVKMTHPYYLLRWYGLLVMNVVGIEVLELEQQLLKNVFWSQSEWSGRRRLHWSLVCMQPMHNVCIFPLSLLGHVANRCRLSTHLEKMILLHSIDTPALLLNFLCWEAIGVFRFYSIEWKDISHLITQEQYCIVVSSQILKQDSMKMHKQIS